MKCENLNPAKKNTKVTVNGHCYQVGPGGFIADEDGSALDVPAEDAAKLTQGKAWIELSWDPEDPANANRLVMPADRQVGGAIGRPVRTLDEMKWDKGIRPKSAEEMGGQAIATATKDGSVPADAKVEARPPSDEQLAKALAEDDALAKTDAVRQGHEPPTGLLADSGLEIPASATTQEIEAQTTAPDPTPNEVIVDENGDPVPEWPDPKPTMNLKYLRQMATAYEVPHKGVTKKDLIKATYAAMYEE